MLSAREIALAVKYHFFRKEGALLRGVIPRSIESSLGRRARVAYLLWEGRDYRAWMTEHLKRRHSLYTAPVEPGLLSVLTPVWDGSPLAYLKKLAASIIAQNTSGDCEWVVLNNGCTDGKLLQYLESLKRYPWISVYETGENLGIIRGLRFCLERAKGRYVLPVDSDDWLYPDCLQIVTSSIRSTGFPPLLYTDEDKLTGARWIQPYFKPDFDPVLLLNSAYIAHLGVIERETALKLDAYSDADVEGSPDWDLFVRFLLAGHSAVHIPEIVYSWRMHSGSTADREDNKSYIHSSQKAVLQRFLDGRAQGKNYSVEYSPFMNRSADWWLMRKHIGAWPLLDIALLQSGRQRTSMQIDYPDVRRASVSIGASPASLLGLLSDFHDDGLVCLHAEDFETDRPDWAWEAVGLMELHGDVVMAGGRIRNRRGIVTTAGCCLGFDGDCGSPDEGRVEIDPGYFTQILKQRSVSAVSTQFALVRASFLRELLERGMHPKASLAFLGAWAGAHALRSGKRVVYSPFLGGVSDIDWEKLTGAPEREIFRRVNGGDIIPDHRFYPRYFGLERGSAYQLASWS
ncbi:MAG: glycosyltransferase [Bryobacteraceae bacterium]